MIAWVTCGGDGGTCRIFFGYAAWVLFTSANDINSVGAYLMVSNRARSMPTAAFMQ
jgi:hypothetical protein